MHYQNSDHLELEIPSKIHKTEPYLTPSTQVSEQKELELSSNTNTPTLTIVTLHTKNDNPDSKLKVGVGDQGRKCMKKMTRNFLKQSAFGKGKPRKENVLTKHELDKRIMESEQRKTHKKNEKHSHPIEYLQIKSLNLNEQLETLLSERSQPKLKSYKRLSKQPNRQSLTNEAMKSFEEMNVSRDKIKQQKSKQLIENNPSKQLQTKVMNQEKQRGVQKKTGFYDKLKERLSLQIKEIKQKQELNYTSLGTFSVKMKDYPGQQIDKQFRTALTQRARPRTALTRVGLESARNGTFVKKKRPQSSSAKVLEKREIAYMNKKYEQETQRQLRNYSKASTTRSTNRKRSRIEYNPNIKTTLKHVNMMHKKQNWTPSKGEIQRQKLKQKMLKILIDCHGESTKITQLDEGVEVFSKYCDRMNYNLSKTSRMITNVQRTVTIEEQVEYL